MTRNHYQAMKRIFLLILLSVALTSCSQPQHATEILRSQGFRDVQIRPWGVLTLFQCSQDDLFKTPFTANSQANAQVSGVVCSGFLKGSTIRFN